MRVRRDVADGLWRGWLLLLALALATAAWTVSRAAWRAVEAHPRAAAAMPVRSERVIRAVPDATTIAAGTSTVGATGTTALPPLPISADAAAALVAAEPGVVAARPFALGHVGARDRARVLQCLADAIYYEAGGEPDAGQRAVAQVVLNRVRHPAFPATVCGVVYQGLAATGCQFSFACDGALARIPTRGGWARATAIAAAALAGYVYAPVGLATHYHSYAVTPAWNRGMVMTGAVGAHLFHRWPGYWGTSAAFQRVYAGGEPPPGPPAPASAVPPLPMPATVAPVAAPATIQPAGDRPDDAAATSDDHLPPAATVLPRWRDSGQPL